MGTLSEAASRALVAEVGVVVSDWATAADPDAAVDAAREMGLPVVVKLCGDTIGVVWHPSAFLPRALRVNDTKLSCPVGRGAGDSPDKVVPNVVEILARMRDLGEGLVSTVQLCATAARPF